MNIFYDILGNLLSGGILVYFSIAFYYNCKYFLLTKGKNKNDWIYLTITSVSLGWIVTFSYVLVKTIIGEPPIDSSSFGAVFIRPLILLTSVGTAISARMRYNIEKGLHQWKKNLKT